MYAFLFATFIVSLIVSFTSVGFPYSNDVVAPRLQRFRAIHHSRTLFSPDGNAIYSDGKFIVQTTDRNAYRTLETTFGKENLEHWNNGGPTCHLINCGFTHYNLERALVYSNISTRNSIQPTNFTLVRAQRQKENLKRIEIEFTLKLRSLTHLSITPAQGITFNSNDTTIYTRESTQNGRLHYISRIAFGKQFDETQNALVILEVKF